MTVAAARAEADQPAPRTDHTLPRFKNDQPPPRLKKKSDAPESELFPRVPLADFSAGFEAENARDKIRGAAAAPRGMQSLDAHKQDPIAPFVGFSLKRPLD